MTYEEYTTWELSQKIDELEKKLAEAEARIKDLEEILEEVEDKTSEKESALEDAQYRVEELEGALGDLCSTFSGFVASAEGRYADPDEVGAYERCKEEVEKKMSELDI